MCEQDRKQQPSNNRQRERLLNLRPRSDSQREWEQAGCGSECGHKYRPQPQLRRFEHRVFRSVARVDTVLGAIEQQDPVLRHDAGDHDDTHER